MTFPDSVLWLVLEFDSQCGTAQAEDTLQLFVPGSQTTDVPPSIVPIVNEEQDTSKTAYWPILRKFHGTTTWPKHSVVIPGQCFDISNCKMGKFVSVKFL